MSALLSAYDEQLRGASELDGAQERTTIGPLHLGVFPGGTGFVGYRSLDGAGASGVRDLVREASAYFAARPGVGSAEWKTRGHDEAPGLLHALAEAGFVAEESESVMLGEASLLAVEVPLPEGVRLREVRERDDVFAMERMQGRVFDDPHWERRAQRTVDALAGGADVVLWVAETDEGIISAGRLQPVAGTSFAGIWGGSTLPEWRGRGVYRALTARRARAALERGIRYLHSDSTEFSRPILERSGMRVVTTTTPYVWTRPA